MRGSLRASQRVAARHRAQYDVTLTPTVATETPRVGHLRPDPDYDEIMGRLMDWVAFTAAPERHRRACHLAAPGHDRRRAAPGHDAGGRSGP